ncbi:hypothetical protein B0F86_21665 [Pseudomonas syringae]|nr:hypothetical protein B0F86_21665 [Pseudomonas syringae]
MCRVDEERLDASRASGTACPRGVPIVTHKSAFDSGRRPWERTCSRRRSFRKCIFGECTGPFANKFAPTPAGQKRDVQALQYLCLTMSAEHSFTRQVLLTGHKKTRTSAGFFNAQSTQLTLASSSPRA